MQGHLDSELTDFGVKQAEWLRKRLATTRIDYIYSSPLGRAYNTANILKANREIEIIKESRLSEIHLGRWQGKTMNEIIEIDAKNYDYFWNKSDLYVSEGGESFLDVMNRIVEFYNEVVEQHPEGTVLIVAHAVVLRSLLCYLFHQGDLRKLWKKDQLMPASLTVINVDEKGAHIELMADTSHYEEVREDEGWFTDIR
jgi:probable phosphoglycerate mutase